MSGCGLLADPPLGGSIADPALSGALPADPASTGAVVVETEIEVELGAGQGIAGPGGPKGDTGPAGPAAPAPRLWPIVGAASFTAAHGLLYPPDAQILTAEGEMVEADVFHAPGQTTVMFPSPFTGSLYLR